MEPDQQTDGELPQSLKTRITMLSLHDSKLERRYQKILSKNERYAKEREKGSFMDPKLSDFHTNLLHPVKRRNIKVPSMINSPSGATMSAFKEEQRMGATSHMMTTNNSVLTMHKVKD